LARLIAKTALPKNVMILFFMIHRLASLLATIFMITILPESVVIIKIRGIVNAEKL